MCNALECLVGKTIKEVRIQPSNTYIEFDTNEGVFSYITDADCCSESWINHISGLQAIIGEKIVKTEEIEMPKIQEGQEGFSGKQDVDKIYSFKMFTSQGVCELEMRNASNGFYGGSLNKVDKLDCHLKPVYEDF